MLRSSLLSRWLPLALVMSVAVVLALFPARGVVDGWALSSALDAAHLPAAWIVFAALARALPAAWPSPRRLTASAAVVTLLALLVEVIQPVVGRQAEWSDLVVGFVGVGVGVLWAASAGGSRRTRWSARAAGLVVCAVAVSPALRDVRTIVARNQRLPVLFDPAAPVAARAWLPVGDDGVPAIERHPRAPVPTWEIAMDGAWQGIRYEAGRQDWWGYEAVEITLQNPGPPVELRLRVDDRLDDGRRTRSSHVLAVPTGSATLRVSIDAIKHAPEDRTLGLCCVERVHLTLPPDQPASTIALLGVRLH